MKAIALVGFVSTLNGTKYRVTAGDEIDVPSGADWVGAGLVRLVEEAPEKPEKATKPATKKGKGSK